MDKSEFLIIKKDGSYHNIEYSSTSNDTISCINNSIIEFIKQDRIFNNYYFENINFKFNNIKTQLVSILRWRRCTAYLFVQTKNFIDTYLVYIDNYVRHNGQCFGTSIENIKTKEFINEFKRIFNDKDIESNFGI